MKGKVAGFRGLSNPVWQEAKEKEGYTFREFVPTVPREHSALFPSIPKELALVVLGDQPVQPSIRPVLVRVGGGRAIPVTLVVTPKTPLQFKNTDPFKHRLYVVGKGTAFNAVDQAPNTTRDFLVPGPGTYEVRDERAPSLRMWIVAEPNAVAVSYPSLKGDFAVTVETPGKYRVQAYFAGKKVGDPREVEVTAKDVELKEPLVVAKEPDAKAKAGDKAAAPAAAPKAAPGK